MCRPPAFANGWLMANRSPDSFPPRSSGTLCNTVSILKAPDHLRQITCMAKTEKRQTATGVRKRATSGKEKWTGEVGKAVRAALDKKASEVVILDLRNTPAFTDFFVLCSGQ